MGLSKQEKNIVVGVFVAVGSVGLLVLGLSFTSAIGEESKNTARIMSGVATLAGAVVAVGVYFGVEADSDEDKDSFRDVSNGANYGGSGILDLPDDAGDESGAAMRGGAADEVAPLDSNAGMSGQPGDYSSGGDMADDVAAAARSAGSPVIGADIPDDELAAWSGLQNPGASETMIISHQDMIGIDTVGQTMRNRTRDIRGEPIIPPKYTSPWSQSTIRHADLDNVLLTLPNA